MKKDPKPNKSGDEGMKKIPPANPRKWLAAVKDIFGDTYLTKLFKVSLRSLHRYIAQSPYVDEESVRANYIEKHEIILARLINDGYEDLARAIVSRHADIVGCVLAPASAPKPDKSTLEAECLDDHGPLVRLHQAMLDGEDLDTVRHLAGEIHRELDESLEFYRQQHSDHNQ